MARSLALWFSMGCFVLSGCSSETTTSDASSSDADTMGETATSPSDAGGFPLTAENTKIEFVGTHKGDKPDPRKGGFSKFTGSITTDAETSTASVIKVEIDTASLWTEIDKLTDHLKSPDFFDVRQFPKASFESTSIKPGSGDATVTGNLTLLDVSKEISFPATISVSDETVSLAASFTIDRTEFGMNYGLDKVNETVDMSITVGGE